MNHSTFELSDFLTGPGLLQRNAFRLAQMPIDSTERKLNKRQQMIEMAQKMGMPSPLGITPIFPIAGTSGEEVLKEALHRMRDPMNRLLDELFWFWPHTFGESQNDEGLKLLSENKIDEALKFWKQGERETENFISTHNLALLYLFQALQIDEQMISEKISLENRKKEYFGLGGNKEEKISRTSWKEAFSRWLLLKQQESFWHYLKDRIRDINHPALPVESADWIRENMSSILFSINIGLIVSAAESDLRDHVNRQRGILEDSGFNSEDVRVVFETFTRPHRQRIQHLCTTAEKEAKSDPICGHKQARDLAAHATPVLRLLCNMFPDGDKAVDTLHDEVAEAILHCQVMYGNKTENWTVSEELLRMAEKIGRGETAKTRISDNIKRVQELREAGNDWCEEGYFELPEPCIEVLEKARTYEDAEKYNEAIDLLREALFSLIDLPEHPDFRKHLRHCIAYCFKSKAIVAYNQAMKEHNLKARKMLVDSIQCDGGIGDGFGICASCKCRFYGSYVNRTIEGHTFPFCTNCNKKVERKFKDLDGDLDKVKLESLDLLVLGNAFDSSCKVITRNLQAIRDDARESQIKERSPRVLKIEWNLIDPEETIELLTHGVVSSADKLFKNLALTVAAQSEQAKQRTLVKLFGEATKDESRLLHLIPYLRTDDYIFAQLIKHVLIGHMGEHAGRETTIKVILDMDDPSIRFRVIDQLKSFYKGPNELSNRFLNSLNALASRLANTEASNLSFTSGKLGALIWDAKQYSKDLEERLIKDVIKAVALSGSKENIQKLLHEVHGNERVCHIFYSGVFFGKKAVDSNVQKAIVETLISSSDFTLQFAVLEHLKEHGDNTSDSVEAIKGAIHSTLLAKAEKQIEQNAHNWTNGTIPLALSYAMFYSKEFETSLFLGLVGICSKNAGYTTNFIRSITAVRSDCDRLLELVKDSANSLDENVKASIIKVMVEHWDWGLRLTGLKFSVSTRSICAQEKAWIYIRALADEHQAVRSFAHTQLLAVPNEFFRYSIEPFWSPVKHQRKELLALLNETLPQLDFQAWKPSLQDIVGIIVSFEDSEITRIFSDILWKCHSSWPTEAPMKPCLPWLKYAVKNGSSSQAKMANDLLAKIRDHSFGLRCLLWFTSAALPEAPKVTQESWWQQRILERPKAIQEHFERTPKDARDIFKPQIQTEAVHTTSTWKFNDERQKILQMVKGFDEETSFLCPICQTQLKAKNLIQHYDSQHRREGIVQIVKTTDGDSKVLCPICEIWVEAKYLIEHYDDQHRKENSAQGRLEISQAQDSYKDDRTGLKREYAAASPNRKLEILKTFKDKGWRW